MTGQVQASDPSYALYSLGWKSFQDLCLTITSEILGQTTQAFVPSRDAGRDGAFNGQWKPVGGSGKEGSFTVQCKFSSRDALLAASDLRDDLAKAARLAKSGLATNYIVMTNRRVTAVVDEALRRQVLSLEGVQAFFLFGSEWITQKIRESATLRMLVPRVYGLGDLSQILDERAYAQTAALLSALGDDLNTFVVTQAHTQAARALVNHGFVLLLGEPAAGKSTIAATLAMGALDKWGSFTAKILNAEAFVRHWNPHEPAQFFWVDDAFGATQYQPDLAAAWNRSWPHVSAAIRRGARILFTSRDYVYRAARPNLKISAFPLINESQVVIDVQHLSPSERRQILYNHIKLGRQTPAFKRRIKPFLNGVAASSRFLPEIARRLGNPLFTRRLEFERAAISKFVDEPVAFLVDIVTDLDPPSRAALALVFMRGGALTSPIELSDREEAGLRLLGVPLPAAREALGALEGSLVVLVRAEAGATWRFKHPTIGDAYASIVAGEPELLDIYLTWTGPARLMKEVTCGNLNIEGVKVTIPASRFVQFAERLAEAKVDDQLFLFLASRCSPEFLRVYLGLHPELGAVLTRPQSYLSASAKVSVIVRLHELRLLPEEWRRAFVARAEELAIETPDLDFLSEADIRGVFTLQELNRLRDIIRTELVPSLEDLAAEWGMTATTTRIQTTTSLH